MVLKVQAARAVAFLGGGMCALAAVVLTAVLLAGCGQAEKQDAPHATSSVVDRSAPDFVIAMPDDYRNVVAKCDGHGHRVYVTSHGADQPSALAVIDDKQCGPVTP